MAPSPNWQRTACGSLAVGERQGRAGGDREMGADDAPAAEEAALDVEQVHRAATAVGDAGVLAEELGHHGCGGLPTASAVAWSR